MLRNSVGCHTLLGKSATEVYGSTLLAFRGGGWVSNDRKIVLRDT